MGKAKQCPLLCFYPAHQLAQVFSDYFCGKITGIRYTLDRQAIVSQPHNVRGRLYSGVLFTHFDVMSEDFVHRTMNMSPKTYDLEPFLTTVLLDNVLPALTNALNMSLSSGPISKLLKRAIVKLLLKTASLDPNILRTKN